MGSEGHDQTDLGFRCPLTDSLDTVEYIDIQERPLSDRADFFCSYMPQRDFFSPKAQLNYKIVNLRVGSDRGVDYDKEQLLTVSTSDIRVYAG